MYFCRKLIILQEQWERKREKYKKDYTDPKFPDLDTRKKETHTIKVSSLIIYYLDSFVIFRSHPLGLTSNSSSPSSRLNPLTVSTSSTHPPSTTTLTARRYTQLQLQFSRASAKGEEEERKVGQRGGWLWRGMIVGGECRKWKGRVVDRTYAAGACGNGGAYGVPVKRIPYWF